jgi:hypothetical protein
MTDRFIALKHQPLGVPLELLDRDIEKNRLNHVGTHQFTTRIGAIRSYS